MFNELNRNILVSSEFFLQIFLPVGGFSEFVLGKPLWKNASIFCFQDKESMIQVLQAVDKANGYCFGDLEERNLQAMMSAAVGADFQFDSYPFLITAVTDCDSSGLKSSFNIYGRWLKNRTMLGFLIAYK